MNEMIDPSNIIVTVKAPHSEHASFIARYISESNLDPEREGTANRPLFSTLDDLLEWPAANRLLTGPELEVSKRDILHLILALRRVDYDRLGETESARLARLRLSARWMMKILESAAEITGLRWIAGIHRNTDCPHVHLAINRDAADPQTGSRKRLDKLPSSLLPNKRWNAGEAAGSSSSGLLAKEFAACLTPAAALANPLSRKEALQ